MKRSIALFVVVVALALTAPVVAQSQKNAPCFPGTGWGCPVPTVKWQLTCLTPTTSPIPAPLDAQWVGIGGKLCYLVVAERPKM